MLYRRHQLMSTVMKILGLIKKGDYWELKVRLTKSGRPS